MRFLDIPNFGSVRFELSDVAGYLKSRLSSEEVPWPDASWRLLGHMAWPKDAQKRALWMTSQIGRALSPGSAPQTPSQMAPVPAQNPSLEYFKAYGGHAAVAEVTSAALHQEITSIQPRWSLVADMLHLHYDMSCGQHMKARGGASIGKAIELIKSNPRVKGRSGANLWNIWSEFKDVAHLVTAAVFLTSEAVARNNREGWGLPAHTMVPYHMIMMLPEGVLALGKAFQEYGLKTLPFSREEPVLNPETVWRISDDLNVEPIEPPARKLSTEHIIALNARRAHEPAVVP